MKLFGLLSLFICLFFTSAIHADPGFNIHVISEIPTGGLVISKPGKYIFAKNIKWNPVADGPAILINANDVILDLQGCTLLSETSSFNTIGIFAQSAKNLTIENGTVANMAFKGIQCQNCENIVIKKVTIDGLNIENTATYTVPVGILVNASSNAEITHCKVKNINVKTGSTAAIQLTETYSSKVTHCHINNMLNRDGACTGIGHLLCDVALVKSCTIDNLQSEFIDNLNTQGHTTIGIIPVFSTNLKIKKCKVSNIIGCCDDAHGISIFECLDAVVEKCKVENVVDGASATHSGAKATGIEIYASGVKVSKCHVKDITSINPQDKQSTGFSCAQCIGVEFVKCVAENVTVVDQFGIQNASLGYGTGFGWAPDPRPEFIFPAVGILYKDCTAKNCQVGFDTWFHIDCLWENIYSVCNQIPILDLNQPPRTISCDACSECGCSAAGCFPTPISITINDVAANNVFVDVHVIVCEN